MIFHGIDLHTNSFVAMSLKFEGKLNQGTITTGKYYLEPVSFQKFKDTLSKEDYVLVEACANAFWFYDEIKGLVKDCYVLNVNKYKASINKTDKIDTKKLTKKLAYYVLTNGDSDDLPLVYVPPKEVRELRALFSTYRLNKKTITQFKCRIHSIFTENGIDIPKKQVLNPKNRAKLLELSLADTWKQQLRILFTQLDTIEQETEQIKKLIYELGYRLFREEIEILLSIRGFSPLTAIALMSDVIDINRFPSVKQFCAYLRTAPRVKFSNDKTVIGPTNRYSRSLTCTLMAQSVEHFATAGEHLGTFYERVKKGKKAGVYRMALIRKMLVCAYYMLKRKKLFYWMDEKLYQEKLREFINTVNPKSNEKTTRKAAA
jgi:Transposase and inactivated derivatives